MKKTLNFNTDCHSCLARQNSVFKVLKTEEVDLIQASRYCSFFKRGQIVFGEGMIPHGLYILTKGKVRLSKLGANGKEQIVRLARPGEVLGYRALISGEPFSATATVFEDTHLCFLSKEIVLGLISSNLSFSMELMNLFARDLKSAESKLTHMAQDSVRERLAQALLMLRDTYGVEVETGQIMLKLRREDMANIIGTAPETAIRFLSEFQKEELVQLKGKYIFLKNVKKLIKVANIWD